MILFKGMVLVAWGTALGLIGCYWLARLVASQLYGVSVYDPATLIQRSRIAGSSRSIGGLHSRASSDEGRSVSCAAVRMNGLPIGVIR